ncbi:MAG: tRNA-(ms[2]io[6]A)-hydroxylase [Pseudohongiellaceae bacterium]
MQAVREFLSCQTPESWVDAALDNQSVLLIDHANCEKKAAATAMNLMYRYTTHAELLCKMSQLAREELLHFQQVVEIMAARKIRYVRLSPSRYAAGLRELVDHHNGNTLVDTLIMGAYIEARSCERFACLVPRLDAPLARFYRSLLKSEARHFQDYLALAESLAGADITERVAEFGAREAELVTSPDPEFRFHSGVPA